MSSRFTLALTVGLFLGASLQAGWTVGAAEPAARQYVVTVSGMT